MSVPPDQVRRSFDPNKPLLPPPPGDGMLHAGGSATFDEGAGSQNVVDAETPPASPINAPAPTSPQQDPEQQARNAALLESQTGDRPPAGQLTSPDTDVQARMPEEITVQSRLEGLLGSGSTFLERARARSKQAANKRGLLNSSMAVQAGEAAAIDAALPIAQQDSAALMESALSAQNFEQASGIARQDFLQRGELSAQEFIQASGLSLQEFNQSSEMLTQEYDERIRLLDEEYGHRATEQLRTELGAIQNTLLANISSVLQNTDMSPSQREAVVADLQRIALAEMNAHYALAGLPVLDQIPAGPIAAPGEGGGGLTDPGVEFATDFEDDMPNSVTGSERDNLLQDLRNNRNQIGEAEFARLSALVRDLPRRHRNEGGEGGSDRDIGRGGSGDEGNSDNTGGDGGGFGNSDDGFGE